MAAPAPDAAGRPPSMATAEAEARRFEEAELEGLAAATQTRHLLFRLPGLRVCLPAEPTLARKLGRGGIAKDMGERGVVYGTQPIDDTPTPFLLYDSHMSRAEQAVVEISEQGKAQVDIASLQERLGILQQRQDQGLEVVPTAARAATIADESG
eukprot:CAMPEP_0170244432 /NCGR_PEP_ID=MMETSP0116_2-20130129/21996_1 /TAXON_ID=400756 /ORGANISM="Durinskia baltica, Strain CSIRO CS-38" /LENGTH=153 /DNA_ID=CAMNT_0010495295 /DNA_START=20 /DNA_END=480 /DNA_ORIENTATION=+